MFQRPLFINYNAGIELNNGIVWNINKVRRYGDAIMYLNKKALQFTGNLLISKVDVSDNDLYMYSTVVSNDSLL